MEGKLNGRFDKLRTENKSVTKEGKQMSKTTELKPEAIKSRVEIATLPQPEKELKGKEAERVKGGGARSSGEEIPQTVRK